MIELRDYQKECVDIVDKLPDGSKTVVAIATGLGKTATSAHFHFNGRLLWLSHRDELVRQPERYFTEQGYTYGIEKADEHENGEDIVSASIQSISRENRLTRFAPDAFDVIVCDEAHHAAAPTYKKVLDYFKPRKLIGLTATPQRGDKVRLDDVFDSICFSRDLRWGIENGYLSRIRCLRVQSTYKMANLVKAAGDYTASSVAKVLEDSDDDMVVTKAYLEHCLPEKRQTIIYCPTIKICKIVEKTLTGALPRKEKNTVRLLSQECTPEERHEILEGFREKRYHCIINCMILTEGADLPETSAIINNRPSANSSLYQQIIGRGTRLAEGKDYCLIIDVVGENYKEKEICTAPTLFGVDPNWLPDKMIVKMQEEDLLEFSTAITAERAQNAKQLQLAVELVDLFTQKKIDIIENNWKANDSASGPRIADAYRADLEGQIEEYDFGDILVKLQPSTSKYFRIQPTFDGVIYLSKPDMLGNTVIDARIPECQLDFISPPMKMEDAVAFVGDILQYVVPEYFAQKWSKKAREELVGKLPSEKQCGRVYNEYAKFEKRFNTNKLDRLQASDLIDLAYDIKTLGEERKELLKSDEPKRKGTKKYEDWLKKQEKQEQALKEVEEARKAAWQANQKPIQRLVDAGRKRKKQRDAWIAAASTGKKQSFDLYMSYDYYRRDAHPSDKQRGFLESLVRSAESKGIRFDVDPLKQELDMWHTGFLINYLLQVKDRGAVIKGKTTEYQLSSFIDAIKKIKSPDNGPATIKCDFVIKD